MGSLSLLKTACIILVLSAATAIASSAQTVSLGSFNGNNGANPLWGSMVQGTNGNFYGTTQAGGATGLGTVFELTSGNQLSALYSFCPEPQTGCSDGEFPEGGLLRATNGDFYGTTNEGGANNDGTVFEITPAGTLTTLHSFDGTDGASPIGGLVQGSNGNFYGTTQKGGANSSGTVFEITPAGKLTTLYNFCSLTGCADGGYPQDALVQGSNGNFYGTTNSGGANGAQSGGTVFEITPAGKLTTLYSFCSLANCADGSYSDAGLVQAASGNFYGTTPLGGANAKGVVFEITPAGKLTVLYNFCTQASCADGSGPVAGLTLATNGNFYGTTLSGGVTTECTFSSGCGTLFEITPAGNLTTLYSFCSEVSCADGELPYATLLQATNGSLYGTTQQGGSVGSGSSGTVFSLSAGMPPFVETLTTSGVVGAKVTILGNSLTGATSVTFNGTPATFTVVSATEITTTVPAGATTGSVTVTTPKSTLTSNVRFKVRPQIKGFTPTSGPVGTPVTITGVSLETTDVTFGGVKATTVILESDEKIEAYVPTGAKTGHITVTTAGGTATSSGVFTVTQ
jgi:uncharacterized repeat protein (TIGR03803 family)